MIEREFVSEKIKHLKMKEYIANKISKFAGVGDIVIEKTPMGEKVTIHAARPGLVIGAGGETVKELTRELKQKFGLENPQIEIKEIENKASFAAVVAKKITSDLERFGAGRFKSTGYRALARIMDEGAMGAEIRIGGRGVPGARARSWRFYAGYLKKSGDAAEVIIDKAIDAANLRTGSVGVKVCIMPSGSILPDSVKIKPRVEEVKDEEAKELEVETKAVAEKKAETKPKPAKKPKEEKKPKKKVAPKPKNPKTEKKEAKKKAKKPVKQKKIKK